MGVGCIGAVGGRGGWLYIMCLCGRGELGILGEGEAQEERITGVSADFPVPASFLGMLCFHDGQG